MKENCGKINRQEKRLIHFYRKHIHTDEYTVNRTIKDGSAKVLRSCVWVKAVGGLTAVVKDLFIGVFRLTQKVVCEICMDVVEYHIKADVGSRPPVLRFDASKTSPRKPLTMTLGLNCLMT